MSTPRLAGSGLDKSFIGVHALARVAIEIGGGEIHALLGENGAGKSTLIKIITGVLRPDAGELRLNGAPVAFHNPREAIAAGIAAVHQERNLISRFSVAENITIEQPPSRFGLYQPAEAAREARRWLALLDLDLDPERPVSRLSVAQVQMVEIAKALALEARLLLLDEPTSSLTAHETGNLFRVLRRLASEGVSIVFVSHKLEEVFALCDHVTVLRDGRNAVPSRRLAGLDRTAVVRLMIGREETTFAAPPPAKAARPALEAEGIATALGHRDLSFAVHPGEVLGFYGLVGAGRSELARALIGEVPLTAGRIRVGGEPVAVDSVRSAVRRFGIGYVSENRKSEGLILGHDVAANIVAPVWHRLAGRLGWLSRRTEAAAARPFVERLDIRTPSLDQPVANLSGGNQQKVSVAKWLAAEARILIVDEPTVGIDIRSKAYLHDLILRLARAGTAVIVISSDMPELVALADRILVMKDFHIVDGFDNHRVYAAASRRIMAAIHGTTEVAA